jgi:hypothetical protein
MKFFHAIGGLIVIHFQGVALLRKVKRLSRRINKHCAKSTRCYLCDMYLSELHICRYRLELFDAQEKLNKLKGRSRDCLNLL